MKNVGLRGNISLTVLIGANLLPVAGVLLWGWNVFEIVVLYWFENVVIGVINILKMLTCCPNPEERRKGQASGDSEVLGYLKQPAAERNLDHASKMFVIPFFTFHYGMFCLVHGVFVFALLGGKQGELASGEGPFTGMAAMTGQLIGSGAVVFVLAIIGSHLVSFFVNFIGKGEYLRVSAPQLMGAPYARIVVLHLAILFGAFTVAMFGSSVFLLLLLIAGKIIIDAKLHLRSHRKIAKSGEAG